jgi:uncharacterized membrane protein YeiH
MPFTFYNAMDVTGTFSFAVAGAMAAMEKKLDPFGVIILAFVTAIGGGTVRDVLLGVKPVSWLLDMQTVSIILSGSILSLFFASRIRKFFSLITLFDALGLGFFTITGMEKAIGFGLQPGICIALGTISGCFGGVIRDVLLNNVPLVFRKEIYASASIAGGIVYYLMRSNMGNEMAFIIGFTTIVLLRLLALHFRWSLPAWYVERGPENRKHNAEK